MTDVNPHRAEESTMLVNTWSSNSKFSGGRGKHRRLGSAPNKQSTSKIPAVWCVQLPVRSNRVEPLFSEKRTVCLGPKKHANLASLHSALSHNKSNVIVTGKDERFDHRMQHVIQAIFLVSTAWLNARFFILLTSVKEV